VSPQRVYASELRAALGMGRTRWYELIKCGTIPRPRRDPAGRRGWYLPSEAQRIVRELNARSVRAPIALDVRKLPRLRLVRQH
jgi:predicted DNA-binding transcriptional regulator AlpA